MNEIKLYIKAACPDYIKFASNGIFDEVEKDDNIKFAFYCTYVLNNSTIIKNFGSDTGFVSVLRFFLSD